MPKQAATPSLFLPLFISVSTPNLPQLKALDRKYKNALQSLRAAKASSDGAGSSGGAGAGAGAAVTHPATPSGGAPETKTSDADAAIAVVSQGRRVAELRDQLEDLQLQLEAKDDALAAQADELTELQQRVVDMRSLENKVHRVADKHSKAKEGLDALQAETVSIAVEKDTAMEANRRLQQENRWLQNELDRAQQTATLQAAKHADRVQDFEQELMDLKKQIDSRKAEADAGVCTWQSGRVSPSLCSSVFVCLSACVAGCSFSPLPQLWKPQRKTAKAKPQCTGS